jgi:hypothetical protein
MANLRLDLGNAARFATNNEGDIALLRRGDHGARAAGRPDAGRWESLRGALAKAAKINHVPPAGESGVKALAKGTLLVAMDRAFRGVLTGTSRQ